MMQVTCPCCHTRFPIEAALTDERAREAVAAALALPAPMGDLILRYIGLFRPHKRALSWDRAARLLAELQAPIHAAEVQRHGRTYAAPQDLWRQGLEQILAQRDKLTLPLKSHGYLLEIVAGLASKAEGQVEAQQETAKRAGGEGKRRGQPTPVGKVIDRDTAARGVQGMRDVLGGRDEGDDDA